MSRVPVLVFVVLAVGLFAATAPAGAELEGVRDCGDVRSSEWVHYIETADDIQEYNGVDWFVFGGEGLQPSCAFARRWAKLGVREAVAPASKDYRKRVSNRNTPPGWKCFASNSPDPVVSSGGILECLRYNRNRKLVGAFSAGPNFDKQVGPF